MFFILVPHVKSAYRAVESCRRIWNAAIWGRTLTFLQDESVYARMVFTAAGEGRAWGVATVGGEEKGRAGVAGARQQIPAGSTGRGIYWATCVPGPGDAK